jgi:hypothetical protein
MDADCRRCGMSELRRDPPIPYSGVVFICWKTFDGHRNHVLGRALAVSEREIGIELATRIPVGSFVRVQADSLKLDGSGTVRGVTRRAVGYLLALELSGSLDPDILADLGASQAGAVALSG